jgi:hypothetical protein
MADVFISYAREDRARAAQMAEALGREHVDVFWDTEIPPSQTWADFIEGKLRACKAVIVLWSEHSTKSQWVREEARMGREASKLIPVMLDNSPPPFGFGEVQGANLAGWNGKTADAEWERVVAAVRHALNQPQPAPRPQPAPPVQPAPATAAPGAPKRRAWMFVGGGVLAAVLGLAALGAVLDAIDGAPAPADAPYGATAAAASSNTAAALPAPAPDAGNAQAQTAMAL